MLTLRAKRLLVESHHRVSRYIVQDFSYEGGCRAIEQEKNLRDEISALKQTHEREGFRLTEFLKVSTIFYDCTLYIYILRDSIEIYYSCCIRAILQTVLVAKCTYDHLMINSATMSHFAREVRSSRVAQVLKENPSTQISRGRELWCRREIQDVLRKISECEVLNLKTSHLVSPLTACSADMIMKFIDDDDFIDDESRRWLDAQNE
jgi:hypothetical protein